MKRFLLFSIVAWYITASCFCQIDWKNFMSQQDMIWTRLPQTWYEAPFMGNGSMGTYICKEPGKNAIRVDVGNSMVHDHRTMIEVSTEDAGCLSATSSCILQEK